ncbi:MAG: LysM peptidoglycan-binding domain-containing protein [Clostridiales Family XIII bacterium]|nr:LysM peptidoglycan-binding domain-containing protein [Clostridiales Family XIII bacterium]
MERKDVQRRIRRRRRMRASQRNRRMAKRSRIPMITLMFAMMVGISGFVYASGANGADSALTYKADAAAKTVTEAVVVHSGDTIWGIAESRNDGTRDTRQIVRQICQINDVEAGSIQPGMVLRVPVFA